LLIDNVQDPNESVNVITTRFQHLL